GEFTSALTAVMVLLPTALLPCYFALFPAQGSFEVSSRGPERKQSLAVLVLRTCDRRLLVQQIAKQNRLLGIGVSLVTKSFLFCIASCFRDRDLCPGFTQLAELQVHVQQNLVSRIYFGESGLVFRDCLLGEIVALLAPVPGLPG